MDSETKYIPKTPLQVEFEKSKWAKDEDIDLDRYLTTGGYIWTSAKGAFEMFIYDRRREFMSSVKKEIRDQVALNLESLKSAQKKYGGVYVGQTSTHTLSVDYVAPKYSIDVESEFEENLFIIVAMDEENQKEITDFLKDELKSNGIASTTCFFTWNLAVESKHRIS